MTEDHMNSAADKSGAGAGSKRKFRSRLERRKIAEAALVPGASVSSVAKAHGVRPNQVRHWRRLYCRGLLDEAVSTSLVAVKITDKPDQKSAAEAVPSSAGARMQTHARGTIRIETAKGLVLIEGAAETASLRVVLEYLFG